MNESCARWIALSDREAVDEPLRDEEREFLLDHGASCAACSREQAVWDDLSGLIDPAREPVVAKPAPRRYALYAALACAAALALALLPRGELPSASTLGAFEIDGQPRTSGTSLAVGSTVVARADACMRVEPGVRACLAAGSRMRVTELTAQQRRLELLEGKLAAELDPQPAGSSFGVLTRDGSAVAIGTAFSVEVPAQGAVVTRVMHGTVLVRSRAGREQKLTARRMAAMNEPSRALPANELARELALVEPTVEAAPAVEAAPIGAVTPNPEPASSAERTPPVEPTRIDEPARAIEPTRVAERTRVIDPAPRVAPARVAEPAARVAPTHVLPERAEHARPEHARPEHAPPEHAPAEHARSTPMPPTADQLLLTARECRARGDAPGALEAYRELFKLDAESAEARAALVPYGELLLSKGYARPALDAFERYLTHAGALAEEADFGRVRALRALGDAARERDAIEHFLRSYPRSPLAAGLRQSTP